MEDHLDPKNTDVTQRGKTIRTLIRELSRYEDLDQEVKVSFDMKGDLHRIGLVGNLDQTCALIVFRDEE